MAEISLNASVPSIAKLCCIVAQIDVSEIKDSSAKSNFHWKTMKCRLIIDTMQAAVLASAVYETIGSIYVISTVEFFNSEILQENLKAMNMTWSLPRPVTADVYANCLRYSIQFALAPRWNRVGHFLINDRNFLTSSETFAMKFNLHVRVTEKKNVESPMKLQPLRVHMHSLKLEDLKIPRELIAHFMADPQGVIDTVALGNIRVTVLPSLKRGKVTKVLKYIPASSPFKNYGEIRRHWKNMYGYRLPKNENGIIYYEVMFPVSSADRYLYPDICVRAQVTERLYLGDCEDLVKTFVRDLRETMPLVCGQAFNITGKNLVVENPNSTVSSDDENPRSSYDLTKTPENPLRIRGLRENLNNTTRLSFSCGNRLCKTSSNLMSPTPSLRGCVRSSMKNEKLRNILTNHVGTNDAIPNFRPSRIDDRPPAVQNRCPNVNARSSNDISENLKDSQTSSYDDPDGAEFWTMEMELPGNYIFLPRPSPSNSGLVVDNKNLVNPLRISSTAGSSCGPVRKPKIIKDESLSKHFVANKELKEEKTNSPILGTMTLSQKLEHNLRSIRKRVNDDFRLPEKS